MWKRVKKNLHEIDFHFMLFGFPIMLIILGIWFCTCKSQALSQNWSENKTVADNYNIAKTYFDSRKQGVINAYNAQVAEIHKNGLKTKDNFNGFGIDYSLGLVNNDSKNKLSVSHFSPKLLKKLNEKIDAKLAKVKHFYNARILNVYKTLENNQKVDFISLTSDSASNGRNIQFSHADFDSIGSELNKNMLEEDHTLIWLIVVAIFTAIPTVFELFVLCCLFAVDLDED